MNIYLFETWIELMDDEISEKEAKIEWLREEIKETKKQRERFIKQLAELREEGRDEKERQTNN